MYSKSEKILGSRDLGAKVIIQSFQEEASQVQLKGVQFRDLGQSFRKHLSALTLVGSMKGKGILTCDSVTFSFFSHMKLLHKETLELVGFRDT